MSIITYHNLIIFIKKIHQWDTPIEADRETRQYSYPLGHYSPKGEPAPCLLSTLIDFAGFWTYIIGIIKYVFCVQLIFLNLMFVEKMGSLCIALICWFPRQYNILFYISWFLSLSTVDIFEQKALRCGAVLCIEWCLTTSLASTFEISVTLSPSPQ